MPKATKRKSTIKEARQRLEKPSKKDPKASHLYTDDNPSTTLHNTGFKDATTARNTIKLVSQRSLTYQFQTINTLYYRALHHPHRTVGINNGMSVLKEWLEKAYPDAKSHLRSNGFKPLLPKEVVRAWLDHIRQSVGVQDELAVQFSELYSQLPPKKRLANTLIDDSKPDERDWDRQRYEELCVLVPEGKESFSKWSNEELFESEGALSATHLRLIAWAWSPVPLKMLKDSALVKD